MYADLLTQKPLLWQHGISSVEFISDKPKKLPIRNFAPTIFDFREFSISEDY